ncbi:hypothetical protein K1T73_12480 [Roseovarius sp. SCSIO 43702]|uniref:hypothetical protein n=1 Tax=Roseovarius sp. SCSIO 43702 TaxID=2823043 RepID=UPI001C73261D|nr:hypothetical protein [Roseovarius sp. SCSIO 43702]QYX55883.1 hypothetical protein K1T73_12480 [Roseovarius sp. SCSIO 43702]
MKHLILTSALAVGLSGPALAQDDKEGDGLSLMEEGARLLFEGLAQEMEPAMKDLRELARNLEPGMREFVREMGPALADIMGRIEDLSNYHPPEMLPNGDIIIRKKTPAEMVEPEPGEDIEI